MAKPAQMPKGYSGWALLDGEVGCNLLRSALHNLSAGVNGDNHQYSRGLLMGVYSMLVAAGMNDDDSLQLIWQLAPRDCHWERIPDSLRVYFGDRIAKYTIPADAKKTQ